MTAAVCILAAALASAPAATNAAPASGEVRAAGWSGQLLAKAGDGGGIRITSRTGDFDRKDGVAMFEGDVLVRYAGGVTLRSDRMFMFLGGANELNRVVAIGNVAVSNETRQGFCAYATFRRAKGEVEMFGDGKGVPARLVDSGENAGEIEGTRIKFWLDSEQVEVQDSRIGVRNSEGVKAL